MNTYILSILVPTKDNTYYAQRCVEHLLSICGDHVQVVVQDNSCDNKLLSMIGDMANDKRLKYNHNGNELSIIDNFDQGVEIADGEYVCVIGDDDGVSRYIAQFTMWAKENNIDALKPTQGAYFIWPGTYDDKQHGVNGRFVVRRGNCHLRKCRTEKGLISLLKSGGQDFAHKDIAKFYHGIVKKSLLDMVKQRTGHYFGGLTPDIYIGTALTLLSPKMVEIDCSMVITGSNRSSGSAQGKNGKHTGFLHESPHFRGHKDYRWSELIPEFYSVETIWAETSIHAFQDMNEESYLNLFNVAEIDSLLLSKYGDNQDYAKLMTDHYMHFFNDETNLWKKYNIKIENFKRQIRRIKFIFKAAKRRAVVPSIKYENIADIAAAEELLNKELEKNMKRFLSRKLKI